MVDEHNNPIQTESPARSDFDLDKTIDEMMKADPEKPFESKVHISEEVLVEIAKRTLARIDGVQSTTSGTSVLSIGRKAAEGVKISTDWEKLSIAVDAYVLIRYGLRIPDIAWDVQEAIKKDLEDYTGYNVRSVNIFVQGVYFGEAAAERASNFSEKAAAAKIP